jgi:hypothetical protein
VTTIASHEFSHEITNGVQFDQLGFDPPPSPVKDERLEHLLCQPIDPSFHTAKTANFSGTDEVFVLLSPSTSPFQAIKV